MTHKAGSLLLLCATARARADEPALFGSLPAFQTQLTWHWVVGAAAIALIVGFVLGWRALDRRIRKKYGGLRIY